MHQDLYETDFSTRRKFYSYALGSIDAVYEILNLQKWNKINLSSQAVVNLIIFTSNTNLWVKYITQEKVVSNKTFYRSTVSAD